MAPQHTLSVEEVERLADQRIKLHEEEKVSKTPNTFTTFDGDVLCFAHVVMARWHADIGNVKTLNIYFAQGPHIGLSEKMGFDFLEKLKMYWSVR